MVCDCHSWTTGPWRRSGADKSQDIYNTSFEVEEDEVTMRFTRKRKTDDEKNDIELECQYFLYAYGGVRANGIIKKPQFEAVSGTRICLCPSNINPTSVTRKPASMTPRGPRPTPKPIPKPTPMLTCPSNCSVSRKDCQNDIRCRPLWDTYHRTCRSIVEWNGNGEPPQCTDECKQSITRLGTHPQGMLYTCCYCSDNQCRQGKKNLKDLCKISLSESDVCNKMRSACHDDDDDNDDKRGTQLCVYIIHSSLAALC